MTSKYDHLDIETKTSIYKNACGVLRDVDNGSTDYAPDEYQHAAETADALRPAVVDAYVDSVRAAGSTMTDASLDELTRFARS